MYLSNILGKSVNEPIHSNNGVGDIRALWHRPQKQRVKGQRLLATDGTSLTYTLLYYIPGLTTYCPHRRTPILTGYMSGCYLFRYRLHGQLYVAHVGTHDTNQEFNDKAKSAWKTFVASQPVTDVMGFDPINDVSDALLARAVAVGAKPAIVGAWEQDGSARVGVVVSDGANPGNRIIVDLEYARLRPWREIQTDPKMA